MRILTLVKVVHEVQETGGDLPEDYTGTQTMYLVEGSGVLFLWNEMLRETIPFYSFA